MKVAESGVRGKSGATVLPRPALILPSPCPLLAPAMRGTTGRMGSNVRNNARRWARRGTMHRAVWEA
eukprot:14899502-Alexandrium_andersonii.AAC.1